MARDLVHGAAAVEGAWVRRIGIAKAAGECGTAGNGSGLGAAASCLTRVNSCALLNRKLYCF